jgi:hypothetical protein
MKRLLSLLLLFIFVVHATQKLVVLVGFYTNKSFIEQNLCENRFEKIPICKGQCYLDKELRKVDKHEQKFPESKWKAEVLFCQEHILEHRFISYAFIDSKKPNFQYTTGFYTTTYFQIFHPPQSIV